jgi:hypothetical protein
MARIRTIKPEFWNSPIMGRQDDATKLMAIALLNYADDEGFFHAEANLVRGFCRPFDDNSTITRRSLDNLVKIEYISICKNDLYGEIGLIEKFKLHQKIDRPTDSKLSIYYSTNTRRILDEYSTLERKGKERKGTGKGKEFIPPDVDEVILYFKENGYDEKTALKMFKSYSVADWVDSKGNKIKNWKQKAINVWFKDENKIKPQYKTKPSMRMVHYKMYGQFYTHAEFAYLQNLKIEGQENIEFLNYVD